MPKNRKTQQNTLFLKSLENIKETDLGNWAMNPKGLYKKLYQLVFWGSIYKCKGTGKCFSVSGHLHLLGLSVLEVINNHMTRPCHLCMSQIIALPSRLHFWLTLYQLPHFSLIQQQNQRSCFLVELWEESCVDSFLSVSPECLPIHTYDIWCPQAGWCFQPIFISSRNCRMHK